MNLKTAILGLTLLITAVVCFSARIMAQPININSGNSTSQVLGADHVSNEILIKFKPTVSAQDQEFSIQQASANSLGAISTSGLTRVQLAGDQSVSDAIETFSNMDGVEYAQPNYIYHALAVTPNDTDYAKLWGLKNSGQTVSGGSYTTNNPGTSGNDMDLQSAWDHITDCSSVIVAVIDSGVNYNQEDLSTNMWDGGSDYPNHGYDYVDSDNDPMDLNGHGTHVAGTIGAIGNNSTGSTGVCWKVKLMAIRALGTTGSGTTANIVSGVDFAVTNGAKVINMSLGGSTYDTAFSTALTSAEDKGVVVVVAAGNDDNDNDGTTKSYPCNYTQDNIVCVAALDQSYSLASFSNYGKTSVDVGAPGTNVYSTWPGTHTETTDDFTSGWGNTGGWTAGYSSATQKQTLYIPSTWYGGGNYTASLDETFLKSFTIASADAVVLNHNAAIDVLSGDSFLVLYTKTPWTNAAGYIITNYNTGTSIVTQSFDLKNCAESTTCGVWYGLQSAADSAGAKGVGIINFSLQTLNLNTNSYHVIDGTSMASPHVAGLAAMLKAYNPNYTYGDIVASIKEGGDTLTALSTKTTSGKAVDAFGSIKYIAAPTGLTAAVQ